MTNADNVPLLIVACSRELTVLKNDTRAIFTAAIVASATVVYLMAFQPKPLWPERPAGIDSIEPATPGDPA